MGHLPMCAVVQVQFSQDELCINRQMLTVVRTTTILGVIASEAIADRET